MKPEYLDKEKFYNIASNNPDIHWDKGSLGSRWDYHRRTIELIKSLGPKRSADVLEMGTMGATCVIGCHTIDFAENWNYPGKNPTYLHDAREVPWPIADDKYELFVALRVFQHLSPKQGECLNEALRVASKVIIVVPDIYEDFYGSRSTGMTYNLCVEFLDGVHPNLYIPTAMGNLFYWDREMKSYLDIGKVADKAVVVNYSVPEIMLRGLYARLKAFFGR